MNLLEQGYQVESEIFEGRHSLVYRASRVADARPVILKFLRTEFPGLDELSRFKREFEFTSRRNIAGAIHSYGLKKHENRYYIILEDIGGESINKVLETDTPTLNEKLFLAIRITKIIGEIHAHKIIHKDINPSNIIWNREDNRIKIIDFGISSELSIEFAEAMNPETLEGTLPYMSPEQTGRMNRSIDYRTDLYSFGVFLYQLFTDVLPFNTRDPMELVHSHIARIPTSPEIVNPKIPPALAHIIMKLLEKNAEDRYQSTAGLFADLKLIEEILSGQRKQTDFPIAENDVSGIFQIPQKLYGREKERDLLLQAFTQITRGKPEILMVSGYSGVGKSALVAEVQRPIIARRGYFISGKFDQFQKNIPYSAIIQAFRELIRLLLGETDEKLREWKNLLNTSLGKNAGVMAEVIPELEMVMGPQEKAPQLGALETQNRFNLTFKKMIQVFASIEHPLVIFLDDLQWADSATLNLIQLLSANPEDEVLLIIGAFRDNEVDETHPLQLTLDEIQNNGDILKTLRLDPLSEQALATLLSDTLSTSQEEVKGLTALVMEKTAGNPFFVNEFLKFLYKNEFLKFEPGQLTWKWDLENIERAGISDNVVELMIQKLRTLPDTTLQILRPGACAGNTFTLKTIASYLDRSPAELMKTLWPALNSNILIPEGDNYKLLLALDESDVSPNELNLSLKFRHDRIQQAAYEIIPSEERERMHLDIGRTLYTLHKDDALEEHIFSIVRHLNTGKQFIEDNTGKIFLADLNLRAGLKAKLSGAYQSALGYFVFGSQLLNELPNDSGNEEIRKNLLEFYLQAAECAFLISKFDESEIHLEHAWNHVRDKFEKGAVYKLRSILLSTQGLYREAIELGIQALGYLGLKMPGINEGAQIQAAYNVELKKFRAGWGNKPIKELFNLKTSVDSTYIEINEILGAFIDGAVIAAPDFFILIGITSINLAIEHGLTPLSSYSFICHSLALKNMGQYEAAYEFGHVAIEINEKRFRNKGINARMYNGFGGFVSHLKNSLTRSNQTLDDGYQAGLESGDLLYCSYNLTNLMRGMISANLPLDYLEVEFQKQLKRTLRLNNAPIYLVNQIYMGFVLNLIGKSESRESFNYEGFTEAIFQRSLGGVPLYLSIFNLYKLRIFFHYHNFEAGRELIYNIDFGPLAPFTQGEEVNFYSALVLSSGYHNRTPEERQVDLEHIRSYYQVVAKYSRVNPENFSSHERLIAAELARLEGRKLEAVQFYEEAIDSALNNGFISVGASANELAGKFWLNQENRTYAALHINRAEQLYKQWGAREVISCLHELYPELLADSRKTPPPSSPLSLDDSISATSTLNSHKDASLFLDLDSVMKASQAISGEINLEKLLERLLNIIIENAGARRGALILIQNRKAHLKASIDVESGEVKVLESFPLEECDDLPRAILRYVLRTGEIVNSEVLNASAATFLTEDEYLRKKSPHSILCMPIRHQDKITGALYLENELVQRAFPAGRAEFLGILLSQAAISLENARVYDHLGELVKERTAELERTHAKLLETAHRAGMAEVSSNVLHNVGNALNNALVPSTLIQETLAGSSLTSLKKVTDALEQPESELGRLFDQSEKGKKFLIYLGELNQVLHSEWDSFKERIGWIKQSLEHIKEIIHLQQSYAGGLILEETLALSEIMEDALKMENIILESSEITLERNYRNIPAITTDRHKVMLILINLLGNARDSVLLSENPEKKIQINITGSEDSEDVIIEIIDTGRGIESEKINKIFSHGFTTKKKGHGFGLHSSANAAAELGGGLNAWSEGPGKGASFILRLPPHIPPGKD